MRLYFLLGVPLVLAGAGLAVAQSTGSSLSSPRPSSAPTAPVLTQSEIPLTEQDRHVVREVVLKARPGDAPPDDVGFVVGSRVPDRIATLPFPQLVRDKVPQLRPFTYLVKDGTVVVIDPKDNRVVELIP